MIHNRYSHSKGFTLVEVMISGFILALLVSVATGPFIDALQFQRGNIAVDEMTDNIQSILNGLDKELRTASGPIITTVSGSPALSFTNQFGESVVYYQDDDDLVKTVDAILTRYSATGSFRFEQVSFDVQEASLTSPPRVTVVVRGVVTTAGPSDNSTVTLQSTTVPRNR